MPDKLFGQPRHLIDAAFPVREPVVCPLCRIEPTPFATDFQGFHLGRCSRCGLEFHSPRPRVADLADKVYGRRYHTDDEAEAHPEQRKYLTRQLARLRVLRGSPGRVLDVGCGAGAFIRFAREHGWDVEGTDMVVSPLARDAGAPLWEGELPSIDFGDRRFDAIRFNHVLEHTRDPLAEVVRARDLLTPKGIILIAVPNLAGLNVRVKTLQSRLGLKAHRWRHYAALHHLWFFTPRTLRQLLEAAGLAVAYWETPVSARHNRQPMVTKACRRMLRSAHLGSLLDMYARPS